MIDVNSPSIPLGIHLPAGLIAELQRLANEKRLTVDEVVRDACLEYVEPSLWERCYQEWKRSHPDEPGPVTGRDGDDSTPKPAAKPA
jgi:hypothetical protein